VILSKQRCSGESLTPLQLHLDVSSNCCPRSTKTARAEESTLQRLLAERGGLVREQRVDPAGVQPARAAAADCPGRKTLVFGREAPSAPNLSTNRFTMENAKGTYTPREGPDRGRASRRRPARARGSGCVPGNTPCPTVPRPCLPGRARGGGGGGEQEQEEEQEQGQEQEQEQE
jgi:hypothetical protein